MEINGTTNCRQGITDITAQYVYVHKKKRKGISITEIQLFTWSFGTDITLTSDNDFSAKVMLTVFSDRQFAFIRDCCLVFNARKE